MNNLLLFSYNIILVYLYTVYYELKNVPFYQYCFIYWVTIVTTNELLGQQDRMTREGFKSIKYSIHTYIK